MASKPVVVIATHNGHKLAEIRKILGPMPFQLKSLDDFPPRYNVRESGKTLEENALIKARRGVRHTGCLCLSDDTGLEVYALKGAPGVYSARYAGPGCTFEDNNRKLLRAMRDQKRRGALFRCVVAAVFPDGRERLFAGRCPGRILREARGARGFGYDPVFKPCADARAFAEMPAAAKNKLSHRALAFRRAGKYLKRVLAA